MVFCNVTAVWFDYTMQYSHWWVEQNPSPPSLLHLLIRVCEMCRHTAQAFSRNPTSALWRRFIDELYALLQESTDVDESDRMRVWRDSLEIRFTMCGAHRASMFLPAVRVYHPKKNPP